MFKRTSGFSLIELLTVIAVIAILSAILVPTVGKVRAQARLSNCVSNLRQWGQANLMFAADNRGMIPWDGGANRGPHNMVLHPDARGVRPWWNALPPYMDSPTISALQTARNLPTLGDSSVFICPNAERQANNAAPDWLCYGPNYLLSYGPNTTTRPRITTVDMIEQTSRVVLFSETTNHAPGTDGTIASNANPHYLARATRHEGRAGAVFFDGHVETFTSTELTAQNQNQNRAQRVLWHPYHQFE